MVEEKGFNENKRRNKQVFRSNNNSLDIYY